MKRSVVATIRRTARRGLTWRYKSWGREGIAIPGLISPLRYDVVVRADFFGFLQSHAHLSRSELIRAAQDEPYRVWFEKVAMARFRPWVLADRELLEGQFAERVDRSLELWRSFSNSGYDDSRPIVLRFARSQTRTDSGVRTPGGLHLGDGGHRLALLLTAGQDLPARSYLVDPRPRRQVIDNTALLAPALGLSEAAYIRFVSAGFTQQRFEDSGSLVRHLSATNPARVAELREVLAAHGRDHERAR